MALAPLDEILKAFPDITTEEHRLAEKLYVALGGGVEQETSEERFDRLIDDPDFLELLRNGGREW